MRIHSMETMPAKRIAVVVFASALLIAGGLALAAQGPAPTAVFTAAQAQAGRVAYENSCGKCHTYNLLGRTGREGDPAVSELPQAYQDFITTAGHVPPLSGKAFLERWGQKTVAQLMARFQVTASDPSFKFEGMNDEAVVNITAYVLQVNGAKPGAQPLTRTTPEVVNSLIQ